MSQPFSRLNPPIRYPYGPPAVPNVPTYGGYGELAGPVSAPFPYEPQYNGLPYYSPARIPRYGPIPGLGVFRGYGKGSYPLIGETGSVPYYGPMYVAYNTLH